MFVDIAEKKWENCVRGFMKKLLGIVVLGLLLGGKVYGADINHCSVASGDIDGTSSGSPLDNTYTCQDDQTFVLDEDEYVSGDSARITASNDNLTINISGNLLATGNGNVITGTSFDTVTITNQSTGLIKGAANGIKLDRGDAGTIDNYGDIYAVSAKTINNT